MKYLFLLFTLLLTTLFAAPAFNQTKKFYNEDGTSFYGTPAGDHHLNWIETQDGEVVVYNPQSKNFEYAIIKDDTLKASGAKYIKNKHKVKKSQKNTINTKLNKLWQKKHFKHSK